jgi:tripartite motif-containing protein 71
MRVEADDPMAHTWSSEHGEGEVLLKLDNTPPHGITLSGLPSKGEVLELGEVEAHVKVEATDGEGSTRSSGIKSIALGVEGKEIGKSAGSCPEGPCTASAEWSLNGAELGVGTYYLTVVATDNVGNVARKNFLLKVNHASPVAMGPGSVNPESGDFALGASDVALSGGAGALEVTRHYDSRNVKEGEEGPLGPQWTVSLGSLASLEVLPGGSVMVVGPEGLTFFNLKTGGGFEAPEGDSNLTLELKGSEYLLKDAAKGTTTRFTLPSGANMWMPTVSEGPVATDTTTDTYTTAEPEAGKKIVEPTLELAPHASASCPAGEWEKWEKGCRGLEFVYAGKTKEHIGESEGEWGEYKGRLMEVKFVAYNPATTKIARSAVAKYEYDKLGRLRAEWNPEISPALKTIYGYDAEGHVTAITPPGQEPWAVTYGTIPGDSSTGRLLKVTRAPASAGLWSSGAPENYQVPQLSGSQVVGETMGVSKGTWSNSPVAYGYQWEDCSEAGGPCTPILGATNPDYTVQATDAGHTLAVQVSATNGGGTITAISAQSHPGPAGAVFSSTFGSEGSGEGQFLHPAGVAVGANGDLWVVDQENDRVEEFSGAGEFLKAFGSKGSGNGQLFLPAGLALDAKGDVWVADGGNYRVEEFNEKGEYVQAFGSKGTGSGQFAEYGPSGIAIDGHGNVWVTDKHGGRVEVFNEKGEYQKSVGSKGTGAGQLEEPMAVAIGPTGNVWVTDWVNNRVTEYNEKGEYVREVGSEGTADGQFERPYAIAVEADGDVWVGDSYNQRVQEFNETGGYLNQFGQAGYEPDQFGFYPGYGLAVDSKGDIWASDPTNDRIAKWHVPGYTTFQGTFGSYGSGNGQFWHPAGVEVDAKGNLWVVDQENDRVEEFNGAGEFLKAFGSKGSGNGELSLPAGLALDAKGDVWVADGGNYRVEEFNEKGEYVQAFGSKGTGSGQFAEYGPSGIAVDAHGNVWVTDKHGGRVEVFNEKGEYQKSVGSKGTGAGQLEEPMAVAIGPTGNVWVTDWVNNRVTEYNEKGEYVREVGSEGKGNGQFERPLGIAVDSSGDVWVGDSYNQRIQEFNEKGEYLSQFGSAGYEPDEFGFYPQYGITVDSKGDLWASDPTNNRITKWAVTGGSVEGKQYAPGPGTTIEYGVPLSGSGAPQQMSESEIAKWGQKKEDKPAYAAAVFPPDEPQGWPASDYKRARIAYTDSQGLTVNTASPSGAVSTTEYDEQGQATRSLTPENRAAALKEGCKAEKECRAAEVAALLDTKSAYNSEGQLTDTWGPQHVVKLVSGKEGKPEEVLARNHVKYHYDEGAPGGETYNLVTKTEDGAETTSKEEFDKRTSTTSYSGQGNLGWKLREPTSTTTDPGGLNLTSTTVYEEGTGNVIETQTPAADGEDKSVPPAFAAQFGTAGSEAGQLKEPRGTAIASNGNVYVLDSGNSRIDEFSPTGTFQETFGWGVSDGKAEFEVCKASCKAGIAGSGNGQLKAPYALAVDSKGDLWVADTGNDRVQEFNSKNEYVSQFGKEGTAEGQFKEPKGIAVTASGELFVSDAANDRIEKFNEKGEFQAAFGWGVSNGEAKAETCTSGCKAGIAGSGAGQLSTPRGLTATATGKLWVADEGNNRIEEFSESGGYITTAGSTGSGSGQFKEPNAITSEASTGNLWVSDSGNDRLQQLTSSGAYISSVGVKGTGNGQFEEPGGASIASAGSIFVADVGNNRIERWVPTITGNTAAHDTKTVYYTAKGEAEVEACRGHIEWAGLPCQTKPVAQPGVSGLPYLPVTTISYNIWDQPEKVEEAFVRLNSEKHEETVTRTKKTTYDAAGRPVTIEETASPATDEKLPTVTDKYNTTNGTVEEQSTTEPAKTLVTKYNTLGQLETYADADGNIATFEYEDEKDARLRKVTDARGNQKYVYNETTGALSELVDSAAGTFKAEYDLAGEMSSETYPNAMTATYTHNSVGETTGIEYEKTAHCEKTCPEVWFSDTVVAGIHGEMLKQASGLSEEPSYTYDAAGRLTQTQEIPAGEGCKTRIYAYDEESNRTAETTREPGSEGKCASEDGSTEWHTYDTANTLADSEATYDAFGDTTKLPVADAGGSALTSEYYLDGQVYKQSQGAGELEQKLEYKLDPDERTRETISSGKMKSTVITHYDSGGGAVAWTAEGSGETEKWTRNIPGIDGTLTATQSGEGKTSKPAVLLLHDLHGNVVAEAAVSETETKLLKKYNSTEFGVPNGKEAPPKYAWLGARGVASELPSGVITQDGITYVPITGQPLQTEGVALPAIQNAATPFTRPVEAWVGSKSGAGAAEGTANEKQREEERAAANQPPGVIPEVPCGPAGEYCEGPGENGEEGGGGGGGGCSGTNGCAASYNPFKAAGDLGAVGCRVWATIHYNQYSKIWSYGYFECGAPQAEFVLQTCVMMRNNETGKYEDYPDKGSGCTKGDPFYGESHGRIKAESSCETGPKGSFEFIGWVWGGEPNGKGEWAVQGTNWSEEPAERDGWCNFL